MIYLDFHYAMSLAETLYGVSIKEDDFEEIALIAWNLIGNKRIRVYKYKADTLELGNGEYAVNLPCNVDLIEAVTSSYEDFQRTSNIDPGSKRNSFLIEQYIESHKINPDVLYSSGSFIDYQLVGNQLIFQQPHRDITILYKGELLDDNGLPQLTDKEALAIATYVAWVLKYKEGLLINNNNIVQLANTLKQQWLVLCEQARTDQYLSQNDWDEILDAKVNWDRKQYCKTFKMFHG